VSLSCDWSRRIERTASEEVGEKEKRRKEEMERWRDTDKEIRREGDTGR
jgi:hypothetical protein